MRQLLVLVSLGNEAVDNTHTLNASFWGIQISKITGQHITPIATKHTEQNILHQGLKQLYVLVQCFFITHSKCKLQFNMLILPCFYTPAEIYF